MAKTREQDVVDLLLEQHEQIRGLLTRLKGATAGPAKRAMFEDLVRLLAVHETAEEEILHPIARRELLDGERVVSGRLHEEAEAKRALAELYELGVDHPRFDVKLAALAEAVTAHASQEETEEFARLRRELPADRLRRMAGAVRTAEAVAPTRPHPAVGESAVVNLLAGPPVALFDRIRGAIRDWSRAQRR
ncbi:hemerythrin domain-containing protein [Actinopolymorpha pittospori]|uniref:Hemerythrin superfamily protein n=1 Tax=Actinopolymorpha pittospori TaxID=648752 RepID=A0A927RQG2_9ACTN|nr:hemerythrin domain-containing protein [Actinopolymorpha pittospori]MBE1612198.1 hemerythrin superfamily protein [Actinopolymorpha pittospori]